MNSTSWARSKWVSGLLVVLLAAGPSFSSLAASGAGDDDELARAQDPIPAPIAAAGQCRSGPPSALSPGARADLSIVETSAPGPWRHELKRQPPRRRLPGEDTGRVVSPASPTPMRVDTSRRWVQDYRPDTPEAHAELELWKEQERMRMRRAAELDARAPDGFGGAELDRGTAVAVEGEAVSHVVREEEYPVSSIDLQQMPRIVEEGRPRKGPPDGYHHQSGLTKEEYVREKMLAQSVPPTPEAQEASPGTRAPQGPLTSFDAILSPLITVPPDPMIAVGPTHVVVVVNSRFQIFDKTGNAMLPEITLNSFFQELPDCQGAFDVFADYDEANDRFVIGAETVAPNDDSYLCVAATASGDPTTIWHRFAFRADLVQRTKFLDYPHMAIGLDAVYISVNMFDDDGDGFDHIRLFALDKDDLYNGTPLSVAEAEPFGASTFVAAQPAKLHGYTSGGWPTPGTFQFFIARSRTGSNVSRIFRWRNPFVIEPSVYGDISPVYGGTPPNAPELGGTPTDLNDTGVGLWYDAEYRDGTLWAARNVACNLGGGEPESCIDWVAVNTALSVPLISGQQSGGAFGSPDEFRYYPDLAVDRNNNVAIGYTKSSATTYPEIWATGREATDPAGTLQAEVLQRAGDGPYVDGKGCTVSAPCDRWGDYTAMTVDPDGCRFWYVGEFSTGGTGSWATNVGSYQFDSCSVDSALQLDKGTYTCDDSLTVTISDSIRISADQLSAQVSITAPGDSETVLPGSWSGSDCVGADCASWTTTLAVSGGAGSNDDGTVNVADAESVTVDYTDPHPAHANQSRSFVINCRTRFQNAGYTIEGGCEQGSGTERYRDYMDAGEYIAYTFGLFNPNPAVGTELTDVELTLSVSGPAAGLVTIYNPTIYLGSVAHGSVSSPVFQLYLDPAIDAATYRLSTLQLELSITSEADGLTIPQVLTQERQIQADDNIVTESECWNFETGAQGFVSSRVVYTYDCDLEEGCDPPATVDTVAAPWIAAVGCGNETRSDYPEMTCDTATGTMAFKSNEPDLTCAFFNQSLVYDEFGGYGELMDDVLYTPIFGPLHTGDAANGQPWHFQWTRAEWFYRSNMEYTVDVPAASAAHYWAPDYDGEATPGTNETATDYPFLLDFFYYPNQPWDSATPWDPENPPANYDAVIFGEGSGGPATVDRQWRWAVELVDVDFGENPTNTPQVRGLAIDDMSLVYDQYHTQEQVGVCTSAPGTVSFDRSRTDECPSGSLAISVLDGDAAGPVTVTVVSDATGDSETVSIAGPGPYFATDLAYNTAAGLGSDDGTLFVTSADTVRVTYDDASPAGSSTDEMTLSCEGGNVVVTGVAALLDNGDGDAFADTNETVDISLQIRNDAGEPLTNATAWIFTDDPDVDCMLKNVASFGEIPPRGGKATNDVASDPYTFKIADSTECADPDAPPTLTFKVLIAADGFAGPNSVQQVTLRLDLDELPGKLRTFVENFDEGPGDFTHEVGPGDDDEIDIDPNLFPCTPYVDDFFWRPTGGLIGGGFFAWQSDLDLFPDGTYSDLSDSVLLSPVLEIGATSATLSFDHEYRFSSLANTRLDGARVDYNLNGGAWQKLTSLPYDGPLNADNLLPTPACNPLCGVGAICYSENAGTGEDIFALLDAGTQNWTNVQGLLDGLTIGDRVQFRWRVGSFHTSLYAVPDPLGGYGLDNVEVTNVVPLECDGDEQPDVGCLPPAPPMADGRVGTGITIEPGAGPDELVFHFDDATCSGDHAIVLYGTLPDFAEYRGEVDLGCNLGPGPSATITHAGQDVWFNVIWVNEEQVAGHPGYDSNGEARIWEAVGACQALADSLRDDTCD